jgi:hypothetical protein
LQHIFPTKWRQKPSNLIYFRQFIIAKTKSHDVESQDPDTFELGTFKLTMEAASPKASDAKKALGQHVREGFFAYAAIDLKERSKLVRPEGLCPTRNADSNRAGRDEVFVDPVAQLSWQTKERGGGLARERASAVC